jgi:hypothetical protein
LFVNLLCPSDTSFPWIEIESTIIESINDDGFTVDYAQEEDSTQSVTEENNSQDEHEA